MIRPIIIDCDPGIDDCVSLLLAYKSDNIRIDLITTVAGNKPIETLTNNALHILEKIGASTPVARGADKPIARECNYPNAHGESGLGNYSYDKVNTSPIGTPAWDAMYNVLLANRKTKTTLVCIAPLTNVATLLTKHPDCKKYIKEIVFMGGQKDDTTHILPYKEFNISYDPEAADIVLSSKIPLAMVPMDLGHIAYLNEEEIIQTSLEGGEIAKMLATMFQGYKDFHIKDGAAVHDACAVIYLTHPQLIKTDPVRLSIKYYDELGSGCVYCDFGSKPNALICTDINIDGFKELFFDTLTKY